MGARVGVLVAVKTSTGARDRIRTCVAVKAAVLQTAGISHSPTRAGAFALPSTEGRGRRPRWAVEPEEGFEPTTFRLQSGCAAVAPLGHTASPSDGRQREPTALSGGHRAVYGGPLGTINSRGIPAPRLPGSPRGPAAAPNPGCPRSTPSPGAPPSGPPARRPPPPRRGASGYALGHPGSARYHCISASPKSPGGGACREGDARGIPRWCTRRHPRRDGA